MQATLSDAVAVLKSSPMIFALCLMVISYGVGHRLFEFAWKGQLRMQYPSAMAYQVWQPSRSPSQQMHGPWYRASALCKSAVVQGFSEPHPDVLLPDVPDVPSWLLRFVIMLTKVLVCIGYAGGCVHSNVLCHHCAKGGRAPSLPVPQL